MTSSDCTETLEEDDVIQLISADTLVDTYELRGVSKSPFEVTISDTNDPVIPADGDNLTVQVEVTHNGNNTASEEVSLAASAIDDGSMLGEDTESRTLDPGETETYTFELEAEEEDTGAYVVSAIGSTDADATEVGVADYGCDEFDSSENEITIEENEVVSCDFTGEYDDVRLIVEGSLVGDATVDEIELDGDGLVAGEIETAGGLDMRGSSFISGNVTSDGENVNLRGSSSVNGSITNNDGGKDLVLQADGPSEVNGNLTSARNLEIRNGNTVTGSVAADHSLIIGGSGDLDPASVTGPMEADEEIVLNDDVTVEGDLRQVVAGGKGFNIKQNVFVDGDIYADQNEVYIADDTVVEGDVFIDDLEDIDCGTDVEINGQSCEEYKSD
ncbi:MAG: hypothetical protein ACQETI_12380 [Halobacteriota archaeon]